MKLCPVIPSSLGYTEKASGLPHNEADLSAELTQGQVSAIQKAFSLLQNIPYDLLKTASLCHKSIKEAAKSLLAYLQGIILRCLNAAAAVWRREPSKVDNEKGGNKPDEKHIPPRAGYPNFRRAHRSATYTGSATARKDMQDSTTVILANIFQFLMDPEVRKMTPVELRELLEAAQENRLASIDERTGKFMQRIVASLEEELKLSEKLAQSFARLAEAAGDPHMLTKVIEGTSFPLIQNLINELDRECPGYVDAYLTTSSDD